jgi:hypothetical protein
LEDIMRISNTMLATAFLGLLTCGIVNSAQAAPLPTNIATMKSMSNSDVEQARWGGWRGGWGYRGGGYRGGWGYRGWGLGASAAGAIVGGAIASGGYYGGYGGYGGYPYNGGSSAYGYDYCPPQYGYGGYAPAYQAYPYRRYYSGW